MEKDTEVKPENTGTIQERNPDGTFPKGVSGNPAGKPKGTKDFYTDFKNAIKQIKDKNTGEELTETHIIKIGLEKMLKGDVRFEGLYKDLMDRVYGKPMQKQETDITSNGETLQGAIINIVKPNGD